MRGMPTNMHILTIGGVLTSLTNSSCPQYVAASCRGRTFVRGVTRPSNSAWQMKYGNLLAAR